MKTFEVKIKGTTPLLLNRWTEEAEQSGETRAVVVNRGTPRERATKAAYILANGSFYFPGTAIARMLREQGGGHKLKGSRKSVKYVIPAAVLIMDDAVLIRNGDGEALAKDFEVDSRPVVIPATKGRIMAHRPRFDCWSASFSVRVNTELLPDDFIQTLLSAGGQQTGIGAFRPEKGGPFGTFIVTQWKEQSKAECSTAEHTDAQRSLSEPSVPQRSVA